MQSGEPLQQAQNPFRSPRDPIRLPLAIPAFKIVKHRSHANMFRAVLIGLLGQYYPPLLPITPIRGGLLPINITVTLSSADKYT